MWLTLRVTYLECGEGLRLVLFFLSSTQQHCDVIINQSGSVLCVIFHNLLFNAFYYSDEGVSTSSRTVLIKQYRLVFFAARSWPIQTSLVTSLWSGARVYATTGRTAGTALLESLEGLSGSYFSWVWGTSWKRRLRSYNAILGNETNHKPPKQLSKNVGDHNHTLEFKNWGAPRRWEERHKLRRDPLRVQGFSGLFHARCLTSERSPK